MGNDLFLADRLRGCLAGGAVGDAIGAPLEFLDLADIREEFGPAGLTADEVRGMPLSITDDTQMCLFTAEGMLEHVRTGEPMADCMYEAYQRWYWTQGGRHGAPPEGVSHGYLTRGWLVREQALRRLRAPGLTCMGALASGALYPGNDSKGCGGVMRVAPVAMLSGDPFRDGCTSAALTHGHPTGSIAAGAFADILFQVFQGKTVLGAVYETYARLAAEPGSYETRSALAAAVEAAARGPEGSVRMVESLGQGWVAEEALAIALYCALVARSFQDGVLLAVNHGGDSDSTGALAGQVIGARDGVGALPPQWLERLLERPIVERMADEIVGAVPATTARRHSTAARSWRRLR